MILQDGNRVLIVHRRLYDNDLPRFFVGIVDGYEAGICKATGYSWVKDTFASRLIGKREKRSKIFSLSSGTLLVYQLPDHLQLEKLSFEVDPQRRLWLGDGLDFKMDLSEREFTPN